MKSKREYLPDERNGTTIAVDIGNVRAYISTGEYSDGRLGELFIKVGKQGDIMAAYDLVAIAISIGLQYGIPLNVFVDKFEHYQMEPSGVTNNADIPIAKSIIDFVSKFLKRKYC